MARGHALGAWVLAAGLVAGAACSTSGDTPAAEAPSPVPPPGAGSPVAEAIVPLPPAAPLPRLVDLPAPTALHIGALAIAAAPVVPVGVEAGGEMEVPGAREVGWYRFGARPGDDGSAVMAAHIAYDGVDGVFRHLADLRPGDAVTVRFADGTERGFTVTEIAQYDKSELPDHVWARGGPGRLVLITCGGEFDSAADRYEDNIVAYASPA